MIRSNQNPFILLICYACMTTIALIGCQWGDEGKGKIIDYFTDKFDIIARYQGGSNAGHTVIFNGKKFKFHHLPSGITHEDKLAVIGNGVVVDCDILQEEIDDLNRSGYLCNNLRISDRAHLVMPYHKLLDELEEKSRKRKIGTTRRGIGPCYTSKVERIGVRVCDLFYGVAIDGILSSINRRIESFNGTTIERKEFLGYCNNAKKILEPYVCDISRLLNDAIVNEKKILLEGAQGTLLDMDHGTYPFVTSSNTTAGNAATGVGIGPNKIDKVVGVSKAYTTRVGEGPMVTELSDRVGKHLLEKGMEYGTTTGRARRCGYLDLVILRYAQRINGLNAIALTKIDVLDGLEKVKVCVAYEKDGKETRELPSHIEGYKPIYEELEGWEKSYDNGLTGKVMKYIDFIEKETKTPVCIVSYGSSREKTEVLEELV